MKKTYNRIEYMKKWRKENPNWMKKWRKENIERLQKYYIEYHNKNKDKIRQYNKDFYLKNKEKMTRRWKKYKNKNKFKISAQNKLNKAITDGKIKRKPCIVCGNKKSHGHHYNYNRPYDVIWLCQTHHQMLHNGHLTI